ncbi:MAG: urease accessory protein UreH [Acidobacteria bacterium]|nr:urease accessory protein UreH [Acidobacteriota bacterium]
MSYLTIVPFGFGFLLGMKHATEADHLMAVTAIVSEQRSLRRSSLVGALWGIGHTASLLGTGVFVIFLRFQIPQRLADWFELGVALMIISLGTRILCLLPRKEGQAHLHFHTHGGRTHTHLHFHEKGEAHSLNDAGDFRHEVHNTLPIGWKPFAVGVVHGLAGSAAITLIVLTEVIRGGSSALALGHLVMFGMGSIGGMLLMSAMIGLPFVYAAGYIERIHMPVHLFAGASSVVFGIYYGLQTAARF